MKILHLMGDSIFAPGFIRIINSKFKQEEHKFYILNGFYGLDNESFYHSQDNVIYRILSGRKSRFKVLFYLLQLPFFCIRLVPLLYRVEKIIFHSMAHPIILFLLLLNPWLLKKCSWFVWGGDLISYMNNKLLFGLKSFCIKRLQSVLIHTDGDYKIVKKLYNVSPKKYRVIYPCTINLDIFDSLLDTKKKTETIYVQIGNSGSREDNHRELIDVLAKYKDKDIKFYCPLSYGEPDIIKDVVQYGKKVLGDKFIPLLNFMEPTEYYKHLATIDILVYNHNQQQGLGNLYAIGYNDKKIFIRKDVSTASFLVDKVGIEIYYTEDLLNMDFKTFIKKNKTSNKQKVFDYFYSDQTLVKLWTDVFS